MSAPVDVVGVLAIYSAQHGDPEDFGQARHAIAELLAADREYDEALTALRALNQRIAESGWLEVLAESLREACLRFHRARERRQKALAAFGED